MVEKIRDDLYKLDNNTYLRKFKRNWGIMNPYKKDLTNKKIIGNINWKNVFRIKLSTIIFLALVLFLCYGYSHDTTYCREIVNDPCEACSEIASIQYDGLIPRGDSIENERDTPAYIPSYAKAPQESFN